MASRGFFGYDPYDDYYYYPSPDHRYTYPYYRYNQPAPARSAGGFFPDADSYSYQQYEPASARSTGGFVPATGDVDWCYQPTHACRIGGFFPAAGNVELAAARAAVLPESGSSRWDSIPVRFVGSEPEPEVARVPVKRAPSAEEAAVRLQAAARGLLARNAIRALRAVEREAGEVAEKVAREAEALRGDARARIAVGEALMRLLLRLDAVHGAREYRRRVTRRVLALQDAVDALEQRSAAVPEVGEAEAAGTATVEAVEEEENAVASEKYAAANKNTAAEMKVVGVRAAGESSAAEDAEPAPDAANLGGDKPADEDAEGEWEMVAEEPRLLFRQRRPGCASRLAAPAPAPAWTQRS